MKAIISDGKLLLDSISAVNELVSEANLQFTPEGLKIISMDVSNISMVILEIPKEKFAMYEVKETEVIGMKLSEIKSRVKRAGKEDSLKLATGNGRLAITIGKRNFEIPIIAIDEKEQKEPVIDFHAEVILPVKIFKEALEDAGLGAEAIEITAEFGKLNFHAEGDSSMFDETLSDNPDVKVKILGDKTKIKAKFGLEHLNKMIRIDDNVKLFLMHDGPLKIEYNKERKLVYFLAPRVENT